MHNIRSFGNKSPKLGGDVWIDPTALIIGDVHLGDKTSVWPMAVARGDIHRIRIGACTNIQDASVLHVSHDSRFAPGGYPLDIGEDVTVGHKVTLHGCSVGDHCLIGMGSVIMDGAVLHPGVMLGAGSLVTPGKELEGYHLWVGAPVRQIRPLTDAERDYLTYVSGHYVRLAQRYLHPSRED